MLPTLQFEIGLIDLIWQLRSSGEVDILLSQHETLLIDVRTNKGRLIAVVTHNLRRVGKQ